MSAISLARGQTTLVVVATNGRLTKAQLTQVAAMAQTGLPRAIRPVHSPVDGDTAFALAVPESGETPVADVHPWGPAAAGIVGSLAADAVTLAVLDAMDHARPSGGFEAYASAG
jgi:L-aminopeptidase/D-esterase-like protein